MLWLEHHPEYQPRGWNLPSTLLRRKLPLKGCNDGYYHWTSLLAWLFGFKKIIDSFLDTDQVMNSVASKGSPKHGRHCGSAIVGVVDLSPSVAPLTGLVDVFFVAFLLSCSVCCRDLTCQLRFQDHFNLQRDKQGEQIHMLLWLLCMIFHAVEEYCSIA